MSKLILNDIDITINEQDIINNYFVDFLSNTPNINLVNEQSEIKSILIKFEQKLLDIELYGPTSKLWIQYFRMVTLIRHYITAERSGNWNLHLQCVQKMIPYFHATGHFPYAKSCHIYLSDMTNLKSKHNEDVYQQFVNEGFFTIRRNDNFWSGIWSDMTFEQTLMRSMKTSGGLTHCRGITDSVLHKWI